MSYLIVDEAMTDLEMKPDPFLNVGNHEIPPGELPYQEKEPGRYTKAKMAFYTRIGRVPLLRKVTGSLYYRRAHRCQSTRSRLRSLNENRRPFVNHPRRSNVNT